MNKVFSFFKSFYLLTFLGLPIICFGEQHLSFSNNPLMIGLAYFSRYTALSPKVLLQLIQLYNLDPFYSLDLHE